MCRVSRAIVVLVAVALLLPIAISVLLGLAAVLAAMGDAVGALVLRYVGLAGGVVWTIALICLVLMLAISTVAPCRRDVEDESEAPASVISHK
jgi:hypothetical protein